jgi:hypothetical protein
MGICVGKTIEDNEKHKTNQKNDDESKLSAFLSDELSTAHSYVSN